MGTAHYEMLKCRNCGKTLGYIRMDVKVYPPKSWIKLVAGGPLIKIEKDVICRECFEQLQRT